MVTCLRFIALVLVVGCSDGVAASRDAGIEGAIGREVYVCADAFTPDAVTYEVDLEQAHCAPWREASCAPGECR